MSQPIPDLQTLKSLAISTLTTLLSDPAQSPRDRRLAAVAALRYIATTESGPSSRAAPPSGGTPADQPPAAEIPAPTCPSQQVVPSPLADLNDLIQLTNALNTLEKHRPKLPPRSSPASRSSPEEGATQDMRGAGHAVAPPHASISLSKLNRSTPSLARILQRAGAP